MLPESWRARVPGLAALQDVLRLASPGRWQPALRRVLLPAQREALDRAIGLARRHQRLYGDAQKWSLLVSSQLFAVSFYGAALAVAALLVVFSDLAFGWSTTLTSEAATAAPRGVGARGAVGALAARRGAEPRAGRTDPVFPRRGRLHGRRAAVGGVVAVPARVHGVLWARCRALALLAFALLRQRAALRRVFASLPGAADLRDRLDSQLDRHRGRGRRAGAERARRARASARAAPAARARGALVGPRARRPGRRRARARGARQRARGGDLGRRGQRPQRRGADRRARRPRRIRPRCS